jgi:hypothetical protein
MESLINAFSFVCCRDRMAEDPSSDFQEGEILPYPGLFGIPPRPITTTPFSAANRITQSVDQSSDAGVSTNYSPFENDPIQGSQESLNGPHLDSNNNFLGLKNGLPECDGLPDWTDAYLDIDSFTAIQSGYPASDSGRPTLSGDWLRILQEGNKRYSLRETDRSNFRGSGWQDIDKSGTYDPDLKLARLAKPQRSRKTKAADERDLDDSDDDVPAPKRVQPRSLNYEQGRKNGRSMVLRLEISSKCGIKKYRALTREFSSPGRTPEDGSMQTGDADKTGIISRRTTAARNDKSHDL